MFDLWRINREPKYFETVISETEVTEANIKKYMGDNSDVVYKSLSVSTDDKMYTMAIIFVEGMINTDLLDMTILKPIKQEPAIKKSGSEAELMVNITDNCVYHINTVIIDDLSSVIYELLNGSAVIVSESEKKAIVFDLKGFDKRSLSEPSNESALKGPKTGFIEVLRSNTAMIRRTIRSVDLKIDAMTVGKSSTLPVAVVYMDSIVDKTMLAELKKRISEIMSDNIINVCDLEEQLFKDNYSVLPKTISTERTDKFCSNIADGKIGVLVDGLPTAIIIPSVLNMFFQSPDDYSTNYMLASITRVLRYFCACIALILPAVYISIVCFHQEMLTETMIEALRVSKEQIPMTTFQEIIFLTVAFEILFESGLRMPKTVGQTVPIIGGLVVGDAAVSANLVSSIVLVVVAVTGIAGFMVPNQDLLNFIRISRIMFIFASMIAGFVGVGIAIIFFLYYICSAEIFGVPYFVPFVANEGKAVLKDTLFRSKLNTDINNQWRRSN